MQLPNCNLPIDEPTPHRSRGSEAAVPAMRCGSGNRQHPASRGGRMYGVLLVPLLLAGAAGLWWVLRPTESAGLLPLEIIVSGDTAGWIVPCGCSSNQSGGLLRRGSYVADARRRADVVLADAGGALSGDSPYDRAKLAAIFRAEAAMQIAAHNIGAAEAALGPDVLRQIAGETSVPLVSTNLRDGGGQSVAEPSRLVAAGGKQVILLGVLSPQLTPDPWKAVPPREAVLAELAAHQNRYDTAVVLAYLPDDELQALATELPEVDALVGGPTGQSISPRQVGPTLLASATNKGKFLAHLAAPTEDAPRWSGRIVELDQRWPDDPAQAANLAAFYAELERRDFTPQETSFVQPLPPGLPADYRVAGTAACRACHQQDCSVWEDSGHARAWKTLAEKGAHVDSYCQHCHTTGFGQPGGFLSVRRSEPLVSVGCESCHGPSAAHARQPATRTAYYARAADQCLTCHDRENSPAFAYETYWERVRHGQ